MNWKSLHKRWDYCMNYYTIFCACQSHIPNLRPEQAICARLDILYRPRLTFDKPCEATQATGSRCFQLYCAQGRKTREARAPRSYENTRRKESRKKKNENEMNAAIIDMWGICWRTQCQRREKVNESLELIKQVQPQKT